MFLIFCIFSCGNFEDFGNDKYIPNNFHEFGVNKVVSFWFPVRWKFIAYCGFMLIYRRINNFHVNSKVKYLSLKINWMSEWMDGCLLFLSRALWYTYLRRTNNMHTFFHYDFIQLYFFDMFRTIKCSSSESLYKQLYGIVSCIYISSLVVDRMC